MKEAYSARESPTTKLNIIFKFLFGTTNTTLM